MAKDKNTHQPKRPGLLKNKYRVTIDNNTTLEQIWHLRISGLGALVFGALLISLLIALITVLIAFTGLREFIPGYPDGTTREKMVANALRADSLDRVLHQWERQLTNINLILSGEDPLPLDQKNPDSLYVHDDAGRESFALSREDSLLRHEIEEKDSYNPSPAVVATREASPSIEALFLFPPIQGAVSDSFNTKNNHLAIDIVAQPHEPVMAVLDGTVVMANWIVETGYVIQIQHDNDILSIYKHNEKLLRKQGDRVKAGEVIAIIGNSGELTTGPHLHFELWYKGAPVDPLKYIKF
jgi:murein DD-endopeptidase MepM/ murein hydrolase activator NlpD